VTLLGLHSGLVLAEKTVAINSHMKVIRVAFAHYKSPFVMGDQPKGLEIDIVRKAMAYVGYKIKPVLFDHNMLINSIKRNLVDAAATVSETDSKLYYSAPFIHYQNVAISHQSDHLTINSVEDLKGLKIVAWGNAHLHLGSTFNHIFSKEIMTSANRYYSENYNQLSQCKMFWLHRAQVILIDKTIFGWCNRELKGRVKMDDMPVIHHIFGDRTDYPVAFRTKKLRDDFNLGLEKVKDSGEYQVFYQKYIK
jgi:polar amino acid transport system substrate-binding protein